MKQHDQLVQDIAEIIDYVHEYTDLQFNWNEMMLFPDNRSKIAANAILEYLELDTDLEYTPGMYSKQLQSLQKKLRKKYRLKWR